MRGGATTSAGITVRGGVRPCSSSPRSLSSRTPRRPRDSVCIEAPAFCRAQVTITPGVDDDDRNAALDFACAMGERGRVPALGRCGTIAFPKVRPGPDRLALSVAVRLRWRGRNVRAQQGQHGRSPCRHRRGAGLSDSPCEADRVGTPRRRTRHARASHWLVLRRCGCGPSGKAGQCNPPAMRRNPKRKGHASCVAAGWTCERR